MPNPWDPGSARLLESLGFEALATTSSGFAASLGRLDYGVRRDEALAHAAAVVASVQVPVSADLENCFADEPAGVAETISLAADTGLAGGSVEDSTGLAGDPLYPLEFAAERVAAAAAAAHPGFVLTARAEGLLHGADLADVITRLRAYEEAGADVVFAPGLRDTESVRAVVGAVSCPVSVLAGRGVPPISELAALGVARVSVGGSFAFAAYGTLVEAAIELRDAGTYGYAERTAVGVRAVREAFSDPG
jgi:2-methylisocitrate lyase-like PEP mutase family enzyme